MACSPPQANRHYTDSNTSPITTQVGMLMSESRFMQALEGRDFGRDFGGERERKRACSMACMRADGAMRSSSGRPKGYEAASITYSITPQDHTSAICKRAPRL